MPKQKGPHKMEGFIDGKIYYKMGNEYYVRNTSAPTKKKLQTDPNYKTVRQNYTKFGAASSIGSCFKKALGSIVDNVADCRVTSHITSMFTNVILHGNTGSKKQSILIRANRDLFIGFQFKEDRNFDHIFKVEYALTCKKNRKEILLDIPSFNSTSGIAKIPGATHYRIIMSLVCLSDYNYKSASKKYLPVESSLNKVSVTSYSELISIKGKKDPLSLKSKLNLKLAIPDSIGIITCLGIEFYQESGELYYPLERMSCMKIGEVF